LRSDENDPHAPVFLGLGVLCDCCRAGPLCGVVIVDCVCREHSRVDHRPDMRNLIVAFAWLSPFAAIVLWPASPVAAIGVVALSHAFLLYPTLRPNNQWLGPVVTRFETREREVWLTIDDGPAEDMPALLELLAKTNTKVTFFLKGERVTPAAL